jgi:hypothetical protein
MHRCWTFHVTLVRGLSNRKSSACRGVGFHDTLVRGSFNRKYSAFRGAEHSMSLLLEDYPTGNALHADVLDIPCHSCYGISQQENLYVQWPMQTSNLM